VVICARKPKNVNVVLLFTLYVAISCNVLHDCGVNLRGDHFANADVHSGQRWCC